MLVVDASAGGRVLSFAEEMLQQTSKIHSEVLYLADIAAVDNNDTEGIHRSGIPNFIADRKARLHKAREFVRLLQESRIRELYLQEIFPKIAEVQVPIGAVNELTGHPNKSDMMFVCAIARHVGARELFEFGTYQGRTTYHLTFASDHARVTTLNLAPENDPTYGKYIAKYFKGTERENRITQIFCDSREFDTAPLRGKFDFIFVDGDHSYEAVKNDTLKALELLKPGGVIVWHDYAPKSPGLVLFFKEFSQQRPLFRIKRTCLLLYLDGVNVAEFQPSPMPEALELEWLRTHPDTPEELYHA